MGEQKGTVKQVEGLPEYRGLFNIQKRRNERK